MKLPPLIICLALCGCGRELHWLTRDQVSRLRITNSPPAKPAAWTLPSRVAFDRQTPGTNEPEAWVMRDEMSELEWLLVRVGNGVTSQPLPYSGRVIVVLTNGDFVEAGTFSDALTNVNSIWKEFRRWTPEPPTNVVTRIVLDPVAVATNSLYLPFTNDTPRHTFETSIRSDNPIYQLSYDGQPIVEVMTNGEVNIYVELSEASRAFWCDLERVVRESQRAFAIPDWTNTLPIGSTQRINTRKP